MKLWNTAKCSRKTSPVLVMGLFCIRAATAMLEIEVEHGAMRTLNIIYYNILLGYSNFYREFQFLFSVSIGIAKTLLKMLRCVLAFYSFSVKFQLYETILSNLNKSNTI